MLIALLAASGVALVCLGIYLPRSGKDIVAERLAAFNERPHSLEEIELQQPFSERVLRPFIRQLADTLSRFQRARSKDSQATQISGLEKIQHKLALAGNPYRWTPADYLGMKAFAALVLGGLLFFLMTLGNEPGWAVRPATRSCSAALASPSAGSARTSCCAARRRPARSRSSTPCPMRSTCW